MKKVAYTPYTVAELTAMIESGYRTAHPADHIIHTSSIFHHLVNEYRVSFFTITNYAEMKYVYVSHSAAQALGYSHAAIAEGGLAFMFSLQHPDEGNTLRLIHRQIIAFFSELPTEDKLCYSYAYDLQLRKADGTYTRMLCQLDCTELDENGRLLTGKETYTDISALHQIPFQKLVISQHDDAGSREVQVHQFNHHLTKREQEILDGINAGKVSKEIGEELHLSKHTVDTYRRRIRRKGR